MTRLRRTALLAFAVHLVAGVCMALILSRGLETNSNLQDRLAFITDHHELWTFAWLTWTAAALAILYFYAVFVEAHSVAPRLAVLLTVAAIGPDLAAQSIEIGVLPSLVGQQELFLLLHRMAVLMSGYVANGLYSLSAFLLAWSTRRAYPNWVWGAGVTVAVSGFGLSAAALFNSTVGMFWTNVLLLPALLVWLAGVAYGRVNIDESCSR